MRKWSLVVDGSKEIDLSEMRIRFTFQQADLGYPNMCYVRVTNLARDTMKPFREMEYKKITLTAGYENGPYGVIFSGDITQGVTGRETPTDTLLTVVAHDAGLAHTQAMVNKTFNAGSTPKDHVDEALKQMDKVGKVTKGHISDKVDLSQPKYPRAFTFYGMAHFLLDRVAKSKGATWSVQLGKFQMLSKDPSDAVPGGNVKLNSQSGLIGMPAQEIGAISARCLINPAIKVGSFVQINEGDVQRLVVPTFPQTGEKDPRLTDTGEIPDIAADGIYRVIELDAEGDSRGLPWYYDLKMLTQANLTRSTSVSRRFLPPDS
jgi:hypothetical protein